MRILLEGFRTFPKNKQSAKLASHSSLRVPASVSSSTLAAQLGGAPVPVSGPIRLREPGSLAIPLSRRTLRSSGGRVMKRREGGRGRRKGGRLGDWVSSERVLVLLWFDSEYLFIRQSCSCFSWTVFLRAFVSGSYLIGVGLA